VGRRRALVAHRPQGPDVRPHDCYALLGRRDAAVDLFERLVALRNDVGLLAEQWDASAQRMRGNFPQAFSHVALVDTATNLHPTLTGAARHRSEGM
jgi:hypothetical protein